MTAFPTPAHMLEAKAAATHATAEILPFPLQPVRRWLKFEEALSMGVGYLALAGFLSSLGYLLVA